jgi:hypothetical protein
MWRSFAAPPTPVTAEFYLGLSTFRFYFNCRHLAYREPPLGTNSGLPHYKTIEDANRFARAIAPHSGYPEIGVVFYRSCQRGVPKSCLSQS